MMPSILQLADSSLIVPKPVAATRIGLGLAIAPMEHKPCLSWRSIVIGVGVCRGLLVV